jgi:hypothetical protein
MVRDRNKKFALLKYEMRIFVVVVLLLSAAVSCGETYQERLDRYNAKRLATLSQRKKEVELLRDKCAADEKAYLANPKAPFLKSCLEYLSELKTGIDDRAARTQCNEDMKATIPSCQEWGSKSLALQNWAQQEINEINERETWLHQGLFPPVPDE